MMMQQKPYMEKLLKNYELEENKSVDSPALTSKPEQQQLVKPTMDAYNYPMRALIGCLSFVAHRTLPDIPSAVRILAMRMHVPIREDWVAARLGS
ncbi:hypothetical protein NDN08_002103 [Rhodosorus marinus]|uniref:Uncharacterized protein n=1 Tax=Rhodosorus marinus TaxID=101924 RepID=A0AAV8UWF6_9RHOD|nr:hypothetical protein NDN08_002103 [Rhodosorus marinus]